MLITHLRGLGFLRSEIPQLPREVRLLKVCGFGLVVGTGALLFASGAVRYYGSASFRIKMALLALILLNGIASSLRGRNTSIHSGVALALWSAVIFAARGIAFF